MDLNYIITMLLQSQLLKHFNGFSLDKILYSKFINTIKNCLDSIYLY